MFWRYFINNFIYVLLFLWFQKRIFKQKQVHPYSYMIIIAMIIVKSFFNEYHIWQGNFLFTISLYFIISFLFFDGTTIKKILFTSLFPIGSSISEIHAYLFLKAILAHHIDVTHPLFFNIAGSCMSILLFAPVLYLISKINALKDMVETKEFWYFCIIPLISMLLIGMMVSSNLIVLSPLLSLLITIGIISCNIILCVGFTELIKSKNIQIENEKLKNQELHYRLLEEKFDHAKKFTHDFKKHMHMINGYVSTNEYDQLKIYLNELNQEIKQSDNLTITGNQVIDLVLHAYQTTLQEHAITIKYDIKTREIGAMSQLDFNLVFSNLLENAIESCLRCHGTSIKIKFDYLQNQTILKITNPCHSVNQNFATMKDREDHGYGLQNIKRILQKYDGSAQFQYDEAQHLFISTIIY